MKISMIQMNSQADKSENIATAVDLMTQAVVDKPDLIVLPECWTCLDNLTDKSSQNAEIFPDGDAYQTLQNFAIEHNVTIHGGSMMERMGDSCYNTTVVFNPQGKEIAKYRKIHLFDVSIPGGTSYYESKKVSAGDDIITYDCNGVTIGCAICYDLRFPELFSKLQQKGAEVIILPAAFTKVTGEAHWEILARARAIETQTHFVAVGMCGTHDDGKRACYGNSMVIDAWGNVLIRMGDMVGYCHQSIDTEQTKTIRQNMPVATHRKLV